MTSENNSKEDVNFDIPDFRKLKATLALKTMVNNETSPVQDLDNTFEKLEDDFNFNKLNEQLENLEQKLKKVSKNLPNDWEKYEDDKGAYYWHVPSGTIQREPPTVNNLTNRRGSLIYYEEENDEVDESSQLLQTFKEINKDQSFIVHSLGSTNFDESQLTAEFSSKAIQRCIIELTTKGDNNAVRCWGKDYAKKLTLKIENSCIKLFDIPTNKILHVQPISSIKVWGVNANNDFAYVARENNQKGFSNTNNDSNENSPSNSPLRQRNLKCHIFHCEEEIENKEETSEAQKIATILKEEVLKFKLSHYENSQKAFIDEYDTSPASSPSLEFPCSLEEPKRTELVNYLGKINVDKPTGIDTLNKAIEAVTNECNEPIVCLVHISPIKIIVENTNTSENLVECRVRYLSFLGISQNNVKKCGFIIQNVENKFEAYIFECRPSSSSLCKIIEEACKIRYKKCLFAHKQKCNNNSEVDNSNVTFSIKKSVDIKDKLKNVFLKILNK